MAEGGARAGGGHGGVGEVGRRLPVEVVTVVVGKVFLTVETVGRGRCDASKPLDDRAQSGQVAAAASTWSQWKPASSCEAKLAGGPAGYSESDQVIRFPLRQSESNPTRTRSPAESRSYGLGPDPGLGSSCP